MDIAPLIDIVFQLLIFFMLTSSFVSQPGMKVHLPKAITAEATPRDRIVLTVAQEGHLTLDSRVVTLNELQSRLERMAGDGRPLLIQADQQASVGRIVEVWDLCRSLGISQVHIATKNRAPAPRRLGKGDGRAF
jgi:biopolymer transport protein ExbD